MRNTKISNWILGLFVCSFIWAFLMDAMIGNGHADAVSRTVTALTMSLLVFAPTGLFAGIVYFIKRKSTSAMWVWTISLLLALVLLSIGATKMAGS